MHVRNFTLCSKLVESDSLLLDQRKSAYRQRHCYVHFDCSASYFITIAAGSSVNTARLALYCMRKNAEPKHEAMLFKQLVITICSHCVLKTCCKVLELGILTPYKLFPKHLLGLQFNVLF